MADLFVASTFGQVRNAAAIAAETGRESRALLITAAGNRQLARRILDAAGAAGLPHDEVIAPLNAGQPLRRVIRAFRAAIDPVLAARPPERVWLPGGDLAFNHIAERVEAMGGAVNFYEDGLSSYRRAEDPSFRPTGFGAQASLSIKALGQQVGRVRRTAAGVQGGSDGVGAEARDLWRKVGIHGELLALASPLRAVLAKGAFFGRRVRFEEAWAAFPDALDPRVVSADARRAFRPAPTDGEVDAARRAAEDAGAPPSLYVSQTYGNSFGFYASVAEALASALTEEGETAVTLKHHPREKGLRRKALSDELSARGVRPVASDPLDAPPAEALFATGRFDAIHGLTSTALLLGRAANPGLSVRPIGRQVLSALRRDPGQLWRYERFESDLELFESLWRDLSR